MGGMYYESPKLNYDYFIVCIDYICNGVSNGDNQIMPGPCKVKQLLRRLRPMIGYGTQRAVGEKALQYVKTLGIIQFA